jgi:DNA-binding CsgD family transcriptional regulator
VNLNRDVIDDATETSLTVTDELPLDDKKLKVAEHIALGDSTSYIASIMGLSEYTVRKYRKEAKVRGVVNLLQLESLDRAKIVLTKSTERAAERMMELIDSANENIALSASTSILDRLGLKVQDKVAPQAPVVNININNMSSDDLRKNIRERVSILEAEE